MRVSSREEQLARIAMFARASILSDAKSRGTFLCGPSLVLGIIYSARMNWNGAATFISPSTATQCLRWGETHFCDYLRGQNLQFKELYGQKLAWRLWHCYFRRKFTNDDTKPWICHIPLRAHVTTQRQLRKSKSDTSNEGVDKLKLTCASAARHRLRYRLAK